MYTHNLNEDQIARKEAVLAILPSINYRLLEDNGQCIKLESVHKWDEVNNCILSCNGKRHIQMNFDIDRTYFGIKEDAQTRTVFNGYMNTVEDLIYINNLTLIM